MVDSSEGCRSGELQCVGRLEIDRPKPVGFLCGTLPVPTDKAFHHNAFNSAIVPSSQTITAPRYRMIPTETDLNTPPFVPNLRDKVLPLAAVHSRTATGDWLEQVQFHLGVLDLDLALLSEKPAANTVSSSAEERAFHKAWEMSNRLCIMFIRMTLASNIKFTLPQVESAKEFMRIVEERFRTANKPLVGTLMANLTTKKFDGTCGMHEHVLEMTNIAAKLKGLGMNVDEFFLVQLILNTLPPQYGPFQIYHTIKEKWSVNELASMLVHEEPRLKHQEQHFAHLGTSRTNKKGKKYGKGTKRESTKSHVSIQATQTQKRNRNDNVTSVKSRHYQNDCRIRNEWFEKKDLHWESSGTSQNLARKCEALAVFGLAEYGDEIDVVAPADIMKQIFKIPYSKARLSIAVHRIGQTLVLNTGPDIEEGEKLVRRHNSKSKCADQSLFLNFAMHSVRAEACDCPPTYAASEEQLSSTILPGDSECSKASFLPADQQAQGGTAYLGQFDNNNRKKGLNCHSEYPKVDQGNFWDNNHSKKDKRHDAVKKASQVGEKPRCSVRESEKHRRGGNDDFQRVLFWQFHNFRMLLGSDLLLFSNEKYVAVSLHLWDVARQVTPLTWLEAWLDNIMASVPELAICYHQNGVVQGYELLKTDDIFLLKGISEDGIPAFHPHVVQQNGLSVLRFLQSNCEQDPGVYWLYKNAGEDVIQLFDLSVIPKSHSSEDHDNCSSSLRSVMHKGRRDSLFSLGLLMYRVAHRLSLSMASNSKAKCARLFQKCFDFLDEQDHLVVRAFAHEQFARLILKCYEELDLTSECVPLVSEVTVTDAKDEASGSMVLSGSVLEDKSSFQVTEETSSAREAKIVELSLSTVEASTSASGNCPASGAAEMAYPEGAAKSPNTDDSQSMFQMSTTPQVVHTVADPISSKLAAVHHVSQAIKALRWKRQLQNSEEVIEHGNKTHEKSSAAHFSVCACGDADCIEVCDIREWLPRSRMDHKLWKLVLLLGESYLALGQAYMEAGQLHQALRIVDLACSVYGSMPRHLEDEALISSMNSSCSSQSKFDDRSGKIRSFLNDTRKSDLCSSADCFSVDQFSSTYLFWAKAWTLVGDIYVQYLMKSKENMTMPERNVCMSELRMPSDVEKEVKRLKKKLGQFKQNCSTCSLINCSCQSDRASSGNSASSSSGDVYPLAYGRKQSKRSNAKNSLHLPLVNPEDGHHLQEVENATSTDSGGLSRRDDSQIQTSSTYMGEARGSITDTIRRSNDNSEMHGLESIAAAEAQPSSKEAPKRGNGGIFKFLKGPTVGDAEFSLPGAISCYNAAQKALSELSSGSTELQSLLKKKGWACNELGRMWLNRKDLDKAEVAFADAISAFKKVSDYTNIILINCNLGHGRRALAEEMVSKMENLKTHTFCQNGHKTALETAKLEYSESLRYYGAARSELNAIEEGAGSVTVSSSLRNEVYTQFAHTYLRLGMLLAREDISAKIYDNGALEYLSMSHLNPYDRRVRGELRKREISANDAIREALSMYEFLGEMRKQEAAYAYFQLACYHRDCCFKFLPQMKLSRSESSVLQKVKQYASLAERNWQKSIDFYGPKTHPTMYLTILIEQSALLVKLSDAFHSIMMLDSALAHLLEGRQIFEEPAIDFSSDDHVEINAKFWSQLRALLKRMLQVALSGSTSKSPLAPHSQPTTPTSKSGDVEKLKKLYGLALKSTDLSQLRAMHELWIS